MGYNCNYYILLPFFHSLLTKGKDTLIFRHLPVLVGKVSEAWYGFGLRLQGLEFN